MLTFWPYCFPHTPCMPRPLHPSIWHLPPNLEKIRFQFLTMMSFSVLLTSSVTGTFWVGLISNSQVATTQGYQKGATFSTYTSQRTSRDFWLKLIGIFISTLFFVRFPVHPEDVLFSLSTQNPLSSSSSQALLSSFIAGETLVNSQNLSLESRGRMMPVKVQTPQICASSESHNTLVSEIFPYTGIDPVSSNKL